MGFETLPSFYLDFFNKYGGNVEEVGRESERPQNGFVTFSEWVKTTSFEESVFLTYKKPYRCVLFSATFREIKMATSSFFKMEQMKVLQNYESLANIISLALGGGKKEADKVIDVKSVDHLQNALGSALNGGK